MDEFLLDGFPSTHCLFSSGALFTSAVTPALSLNNVNVTPCPCTFCWLTKEIQGPGRLLKAEQSGAFLLMPLIFRPREESQSKGRFAPLQGEPISQRRRLIYLHSTEEFLYYHSQGISVLALRPWTNWHWWCRGGGVTGREAEALKLNDERPCQQEWAQKWWTILGINKKERINEYSFPTPWDLPNPGIEPMSPALAGRFFTTAPPGKS